MIFRSVWLESRENFWVYIRNILFCEYVVENAYVEKSFQIIIVKLGLGVNFIALCYLHVVNRDTRIYNFGMFKLYLWQDCIV